MRINALSKLIFNLFVGNKNAYGVQNDAGAYGTRYAKINVYTIKHMLENRLSLLTYQMVNAKQIKWTCLDFDIPKKIIEKDFEQNKQFYFDQLSPIVIKASNVLKSRAIRHLIEFSGNRGFHIWILFDEYLSKKVGYLINTALKNEIDVTHPFILDVFPTTPRLSRGGIGQGVKLPLSLHAKSRSYSYLIGDIQEFEYDESIFVKKLDTKLIAQQEQILKNYELQPLREVIEHLKIDVCEIQEDESKPKFIKATDLPVGSRETPTLDTILNQLGRCAILDEIFSRHKLGLSEKERVIVVGLLNKLTCGDNKAFGKDILQDLFSRMPNYREELTKKKLELLKLHPISCAYLKRLRPDIECRCENETILSPVEHLERIQLTPLDPFDVTEAEMEKIVRTAIKYTHQNDEVALFSVVKNLADTDLENICRQCEKYLHEVKAIDEFYTFHRKEEDKVRELVSLKAEDKVITKYFVKALHAFYYHGFSENSYGYKFNYSLANDDIFYPWLQQWNIFTGHLETVVRDEFMSGYFLIKFDIKSFYSSIDQQMMKIKLLDGPTAEIRNHFQNLDETALNKIRIISETLIDCCDTTVGGRRGVPQGPAFARYLAEIYLMDFDRFVERSIEQELGLYFRYVDDIFIIVDSHEKASQSRENAIAFLRSLNLEINNEKSFFGTIKEYRKHFDDYVNKTKYFIDHTNLNLDPKNKVDKSIKALFGLLEDRGEGEINASNLSFFVTHLTGHRLVKEQIKTLENFVFGFDSGRGSLYRNFFNCLLPEHLDRPLTNTRVLAITGLKREVYLNFLLLHYDVEGMRATAVEDLRKIILTFAETPMTDVEKELITILMFMNRNLFDKRVFSKMERKMILTALECRFKKDMATEAMDNVIDSLHRLEREDFVDIAYSIIANNFAASEHYALLGSIFFKKMLNYMGEQKPEEYDLKFLDDEAINRYHYLCCIFALVVEDVDFDAIIKIWKNLMYCCNMPSRIRSLSIDHHQWLQRGQDIRLDSKRINALLTTGLGDGLVRGYECKIGLFESYCKNIVFLIILSENENKAQILKDSSEVLNKLVLKDERTYLQWIVADSASVKPFPNKDVCIKNIILNDRLVLRKSDELLIRLKTEYSLSDKLQSQMGCQEEEEDGLWRGYKSVKMPIQINNYERIDRLLGGEVLFEHLNQIYRVKNNLESFKKRHFSPTLEKCFGISGLEYFSRSQYTPLIPYSIHDPFIFDYEYQRHFENNRNNFLRLPEPVNNFWTLIEKNY